MRQVGWFVMFDEPNDIGEVPDGFLIDMERGKTFDTENGWLKNHLVPVTMEPNAVLIGGGTPSDAATSYVAHATKKG